AEAGAGGGGEERREGGRRELGGAGGGGGGGGGGGVEHEPGLADTLHPGADQRDELAGDEQPEVAVGEGPEAQGGAGHRCTVALCFCGMFYDVSSVPPAPGCPPMGSTVTILFSDIRGFTEYTEQYGDEIAFQVLQEHNEIVRRHIGAFSGKVVKTQGDSFMVAFTTARGAVLCGAAIQREVAEKTQAESGTRIAVGIGINTGEPIYEGGDFFGSTVNLAARVCATAGPGQIFVSETTRHVAGRLDGVEYIDRGLHELKGFQDQQRLFEVAWKAVPPGVPDEAEISAVEGAVQRALGVLNRVLGIGHRDDPAFRPLLECQAKASELRLSLSRAVAEQRGYTVKQV